MSRASRRVAAVLSSLVCRVEGDRPIIKKTKLWTLFVCVNTM